MANNSVDTGSGIPTFEFGKNWSEYVDESFSEERLEISRQHLLDFLARDDLVGATFLDVGCGSGIHSLAALRSGADSVVSFDVDAKSVAATRSLWTREGRPENWKVMQGSALDEVFLKTLEAADILYSWGVLHHTGDMWQAIRNVAPLVKSDGVFYLALYTTSPRTPYWVRIKQRYNLTGQWGKRFIEVKYLLKHVLLADLVFRRNTFRRIRTYKASRGMAFMTDVRDWLGGWPYEDCSPDEMLDFAYRELGLGLSRIGTGEACTEYLLYRR